MLDRLSLLPYRFHLTFELSQAKTFVTPKLLTSSGSNVRRLALITHSGVKKNSPCKPLQRLKAPPLRSSDGDSMLDTHTASKSHRAMLVDVVCLRARGMRLRKGEPAAPIRGDLELVDDPGTALSFKRPIRVANLVNRIGVQGTP